MPEFPRHTSRGSLTTRRPRAFRDESANIRTEAADRSRIAGETISRVQETTSKLFDAIVTSQVNAFKAQKSVFMRDVKARAALDPDQNAVDKYFKEIDEYNKNALANMSPEAKNQVNAELYTDTEIAKIQVNSIFQRKKITESAENLTVSTEGYKEEILNTANPSEMGMAYNQAIQQINENVKSKLISPDEGKRRKDKFDEELRVGFIDRDLYTDPKYFKKNVANYTFKDAKEKSDKLAKADSLIKAQKKKIEWEEKQINTLGAYDLSNAMINKTLTHEMITDMYDKGQIDSETAAIFDEIVVKGSNDIEPEQKGKPDFFLRLLKEVADDKEEALDIMKNAAKAYANGSMGSSQYAYFVNEANERFKRQKSGQNMLNKVLGGAVKGLEDWVKKLNAPTDTAADMMKGFVDKMQGGLDPLLAAEEAKTEAVINEMPDLTNIPKDGELRVDENGNKAIVYPDGTFKEVE